MKNETAPVFAARVIALGSATRQIFFSKHPNLNLHLASIRIEYRVSPTPNKRKQIETRITIVRFSFFLYVKTIPVGKMEAA